MHWIERIVWSIFLILLVAHNWLQTNKIEALDEQVREVHYQSIVRDIQVLEAIIGVPENKTALPKKPLPKKLENLEKDGVIGDKDTN